MQLTDQESKVLQMRRDGFSLASIGLIIGKKPNAVRQIEAKAMRKILNHKANA